MLYLIRFLCGFVRVKVYGDGPERILNVLNKRGVSVWNISGIGSVIEFNIFMRDYKDMIIIRHQLGMDVSVKLMHKRGLPIYLRRLCTRPGIIIGICLYFLICYTLSQYVWLIDVKGNHTLSKDDILSVCTEIGVFCGTKRTELDTYNLPQRFAMKLNNVAWASFNIEGSKITVNISETEESERDNNKHPRNIVASHDGIIKKLEISSGKKLAEVGDVVTKGDLLVSGFIEYGTNLHTVRAEGKIIAETRRDFTEKISKIQIVNNGDYEIVRKNVFELFSLKVPLYLSGVENYENTYKSRHCLSVLGVDLPMGYTQRVYFISDDKEIDIDKDMAVSLAKYKVSEKLRNMPINEVLKCETVVREDTEHFFVKVSVVCLENISEYIDLQIVSD